LALVALARLLMLESKAQAVQTLFLALLHLLAVAVAAQREPLLTQQTLALALVVVVVAEPQVTTLQTTLAVLVQPIKATLVRLQPLVQLIMLVLVVEALGRSALQT
jgi:hypothetical protein